MKKTKTTDEKKKVTMKPKAILSIFIAFILALSSCDKKNALLVNRRTATLEIIKEIKETQKTKAKEEEEEAKQEEAERTKEEIKETKEQRAKTKEEGLAVTPPAKVAPTQKTAPVAIKSEKQREREQKAQEKRKGQRRGETKGQKEELEGKLKELEEQGKREE